MLPLQHRSPFLQQDQALGTPPSLLLLGAAHTLPGGHFGKGQHQQQLHVPAAAERMQVVTLGL